MIPPGKYLARATGADWGSTDKGTQFVQVEYVIREGECEGETIAAYLYLSDAARDRSIQSLEYSGCIFPDDRITNLEGLGSKNVRIVVEHEEFDGKVRAKVKWINSTAATIKNPLASSEKADLDRRFKGELVAARMKRANSSQPKPALSHFENDADIPF